MSDNADRYGRAVSGFSALVETVSFGKWSAASPCVGWTAKDVVGHVIVGMQRVSGRGPGGGPTGSRLATGDDPVVSYIAARDAALAALTEDNLAKKVSGPMGEMPLDELVGTFATMDVLIHTWVRVIGARPAKRTSLGSTQVSRLDLHTKSRRQD